ncbi:APH(3')-I family aminoglycoside O-phosphotransferase [Sphingomonas hengshuiensis]|nr:APH(3')-I family aminoglycoside O-phosphotransferase [Sphingomonas hengshuiensis]
MPPALSALVEGCRWHRDLVGEAGAGVYRLSAPDGADLYLKHGHGEVAEAVTDEMVRLRWARGRLPVPGVRHFTATEDAAWLLTDAMPGITAYQALEADPDGAPALVDALAAILRTLHAIPTEACPFDAGHRVRLGQARVRIDAGLVETDEFDDARAGWTATQLWDAMHALLPLAPDAVVTHGDFSLDNILVQDGRVTGLIDLGRMGVADRWQDLAILCNCLDEFEGALADRLLASYGIADDPAKHDFHLMLDECF